MSDELFSALVRIYEDQVPDIRSRAWRTAFERWEITPVYLGEEIAAVIGTMDNEIHIGVDPAHRQHWFPFKAFCKRINELIGAYGAVTTVDLKEGGKSHAFIRRLGFSVDREDGTFVRYVLRGPYVRINAKRRSAHSASTESA
jgi:hypothetical protein